MPNTKKPKKATGMYITKQGDKTNDPKKSKYADRRAANLKARRKKQGRKG